MSEGEKSGEKPANWERDLLEKLAFEQLRESRRSRRWGIFFKGLGFLYVFAFLGLLIPDELTDQNLGKEDFTAIIEIKGVIASDAEASADNVITALRKAYKNKHTKGIILRINSPGGSPVQAGYINDEIIRLKRKYEDIPIYAVITDICASGGYYIAVAADSIYVDKASLVGSIGVLMDGYGFVGTMEKLGIERRLLTAGEHKGILDPFSPLKAYEVEHVKGLLDQLHQQFIKVVKEGRGSRIADNEELYSGLFWSGEESIKLGLADKLGSSSYVAREIIGVEKLKDFTVKEDVFERFAERLGAKLAHSVKSVLGIEAPQLR